MKTEPELLQAAKKITLPPPPKETGQASEKTCLKMWETHTEGWRFSDVVTDQMRTIVGPFPPEVPFGGLRSGQSLIGKF